MTSKNSFWASLKENNKRRIWLWVISALGFIVALPTATVLSISRELSNESYYIETLGKELAEKQMHTLLLGRMQRLLGLENSMMWFFIAAFAIISAIQGFSYLYNRNKIDFYMGMPVKRKKRFFVIWLNGIIVYLVPYLTGILISCLVALLNGVMTGAIFGEILLTYGLYFCFYLGVYHLTILAVMMTGNMVITCFAVGVFFLYEYVVRSIVLAYMELFFKFYSWHCYEEAPVFSPFAIWFRFYQAVSGASGAAQSAANPLMTALKLLLFAAAVFVIAYLCYLKRPAEAAGKAMAFSLPKPWIKILIAVPVTLLSGVVVADAIGYRPLYGENKVGFVLFVMAIVLVVTCCLIQVLYEFDIRGILHRKRHILISAVLTAVIFAVFRFDLLGYDSYIPGTEKVESVAFMPPLAYYSYYGDSYFDENMEYVSGYDYMGQYMYLTDVGAVNKLLKKSMDAFEEIDDLDMIYEGEEVEWYEVGVTYRLTNKREVGRRIFVNLKDPETVELLDRITGTEEFIAGAYLGASDTLDKALENEKYQIAALYGNTVYEEKMTREETKELLALYKKDIVNTNFSMLRESIPCGSMVVSFTARKENYSTTNQAELKIYPFYTECVQYLKEKGYYMEGFVNSEDIERIQIVNYNFDKEEAMQSGQETGVLSAGELLYEQAYATEVIYGADEYDEDFRKYVTYDTEAQIKQIAEVIYPDSWIYNSWTMNRQYDENYVVTVYFKQGSEAAGNYDGAASYIFLAGEVPEFVVRDTEYTE